MFRTVPNSRLAFVDTMVDTRLRNKIKASVSECIRSQKIQPFDWLDTLHCIQKLLYLVTSNRGPYQLMVVAKGDAREVGDRGRSGSSCVFLSCSWRTRENFCNSVSGKWEFGKYVLKTSHNKEP